MSNDLHFSSGVPSQRLVLLTMLEGATLRRLTRYSWWPPKEAAAQCNVQQPSVFSLTSGPLSIELEDGTVIAASSDPSLISVILWMEQDKDGATKEVDSVRADPSLYAVDGCDPIFSTKEICRFVGQRVTSSRIVSRIPENAKWEGRPCQVGVVIAVEDGSELILAHGLHNDSDDFSVITRQGIEPRLLGRLSELPLSAVQTQCASQAAEVRDR